MTLFLFFLPQRFAFTCFLFTAKTLSRKGLLLLFSFYRKDATSLRFAFACFLLLAKIFTNSSCLCVFAVNIIFNVTPSPPDTCFQFLVLMPNEQFVTVRNLEPQPISLPAHISGIFGFAPLHLLLFLCNSF